MSAALIQQFYDAFAKRDADAMCACYHPDVAFSDPVFPDLQRGRAGAMWQMLCDGGKDLKIEFAPSGDDGGRWDAWYTFSATGRKVHNIIECRFELADGLIVKHTDTFDLWRWSRQALGMTGVLLGWTPMVKGKIRGMAGKGLDKWIEEHGLPELGAAEAAAG